MANRRDDSHKNSDLLVSSENLAADLERSIKRLAIQDAVTRLLSEPRAVADAMPLLLREIAQPLGFSFGAWWQVHPHVIVLRSEAFWSAKPDGGDRFEELERLSRRELYRPGVGLPGRVWQQGQPRFSRSLEDSSNVRTAQASRDGFSCACAFPVFSGREVFGVLELMGLEAAPIMDDKEILRLLSALGGQIGQYIQETRARDALRESEARKLAILETALDSIISVDHYGNIIEFNPAAERTFGFSRAQAIGQELAELIVPERLRDSYRALLARYYSSGEGIPLDRRIEISAIRSNGTEFPIEVAITRITREGPPMFTGYVRDITERRRAEEEIRRTTTILGAVFEGSADAIFVKDLAGIYIAMNSSGARILGGRTPEEVVGRSDEEIGPEDFALQARESDREVLETGRDCMSDQTWLVDGVARVFLTKKAPYRDATGKVIGVIGIARDITERKRAEETAHFLAEASQILSSTLDPRTTLTSLAWLTVPSIADWCFVRMLKPTGESEIWALANEDDSLVRTANKYFQKHQALYFERESSSTRRALATGKTQYEPEIDLQSMLEMAKSEEQRAMVELFNPRSSLAVPIRRDGRVVGVITFFMSVSDRRFSPDDFMLAEELSRRAGLALDNAQLYERAQKALEDQRLAEREKAVALEQLASQQNRLKAIVESVPAVYWESKLDDQQLIGGLNFVSTHVEKLTGYTPEEFDRDPNLVFRVIHPDDRETVRVKAQELVHTTGRATVELRLVHRDGREILVRSEVSAIYSDGAPTGFRGVTFEVTAPSLSAIASTQPKLLSIDPISFTVAKGSERSAALTSREFQIILLMYNAPGHRISRSDLVNGIWGKLKVSTNSLDVHLFNLRKKLAPLALEITFSPPNLYSLGSRGGG